MKKYSNRQFNIQHVNMILGGSRQYRTSFVTVVEGRRVIDRWVVIEAPPKVINVLYKRILKVIGKCRLRAIENGKKK